MNKEMNDLGCLGFVLIHSTSCMHRTYNKKPIVLLNEFNTPIYNVYTKDYYEKMIGFMDKLLGETCKDNRDLDKAIMIDIIRDVQYSLCPSLKNVDSNTLLDEEYSQYFRFMEEEVVSILSSNIPIESIQE